MADKYLFVTGGVCSSLGKGITAASIGALLKASGYSVNMMKIDPYINVDAGTMNPYQHGEVFVTDDGMETDLDLGNYERFVEIKTTRWSSLTTGQVYQSVIDLERKGEYLSQTVQVIPHITDEIKRRIIKADEEKKSDILIVELGGTVGDIEGLPFIEAIRQFAVDKGKNNVKFVHLTLIPSITGSGEQKTKPTQHSVKQLMSLGIQPDFLFCRSKSKLADSVKEKIALFCNMNKDHIFSAIDVNKTIYEVPLIYEEQNANEIILKELGYEAAEPDLKNWENIVHIQHHSEKKVTVAMVGKYMKIDDTYKSIDAALRHAGIANECKVHVHKVNSEKFFRGEIKISDKTDAVLVPGGFGMRGLDGKLKALKYAREHRIPLFGICLGLQGMVIEYARSIAKIKNAHSSEFEQNSVTPVIELLSNLKGVKYMGGTMRKGLSKTELVEGTKIHEIYQSTEIYERHRHRYEVNPEYVDLLKEKGLIFSGYSEAGLVESVEITDHPWYVGVQFHPEFRSTPMNPHPLFVSFIKAAIDRHREREGE